MHLAPLLLIVLLQDDGVRAEYKKKVEELPAARVEAWTKLGDWCLHNGMAQTAAGAYRKALVIDKEHKKAVKGLEGTNGAEETPNPRFEENRRRSMGPVTGKLAALGKWCLENGLKAEGMAHLNEAIGIDPDHRKARGVLGHAKVGDRWMPKEHAVRERKRLADIKRRQANLSHWSFTITYKGDIPSGWYEETNFHDRMMHAARILWWATRGQMVIKKITISDRASSAGDFLMDSLNGKLNKKGAYGSGVRPVVVGGLFGGGTVIHEGMHIKLGVGDEYGCPDCIMTQPKEGWGTPNFCDGRTHVNKSRNTNCWDLLRKKNPKMKWPVKVKGELGNYLKPPEEWGPMPEPVIVINDR